MESQPGLRTWEGLEKAEGMHWKASCSPVACHSPGQEALWVKTVGHSLPSTILIVPYGFLVLPMALMHTASLLGLTVLL